MASGHPARPECFRLRTKKDKRIFCKRPRENQLLFSKKKSRNNFEFGSKRNKKNHYFFLKNVYLGWMGNGPCSFPFVFALFQAKDVAHFFLICFFTFLLLLLKSKLSFFFVAHFFGNKTKPNERLF